VIINVKYQIVILGSNNTFITQILETFFLHVQELGLNPASVAILNENNYKANYAPNSPTVALYFGNNTADFQNLDIVDNLINDAAFILPIVEDISKFTQLVPEILHSINGTQLKEEKDIESIVNSILEGLSLLRDSRRLFISYRRSESSGVAIQLYERLEKAGFDLFLDTHSVRPGEVFQDELWHRLADTDVVVLLNTKGFLDSEWTKRELAKASAMSIGIIQLVWPDHMAEDVSKLTEQIQLSKADFAGGTFNNSRCLLEKPILDNIVTSVEALRARSLGARQDNLITEFIKTARELGISADLQPEKFITLEKTSGSKLVVLPTVGVPHAFRYNKSDDLIKKMQNHNKSRPYLLYDHRNIRDNWVKHLDWLDSYLPLQSVKITDIKAWLQKI
jgi:hypothetical protein